MPVSQPIKIAIVAMGGEGGGVLADWIVDLGEHNGHIAQTTSVPGVAQRTGATIYYVELFPRARAERDGGSVELLCAAVATYEPLAPFDVVACPYSWSCLSAADRARVLAWVAPGGVCYHGDLPAR